MLQGRNLIKELEPGKWVRKVLDEKTGKDILSMNVLIICHDFNLFVHSLFPTIKFIVNIPGNSLGLITPLWCQVLKKQQNARFL